MASRKRLGENACLPETPALPADLMLEIIARSDLRAIVRCAAASKLLRHDILGPSFICRVTHQAVAPCILVYLRTFALLVDADKPLSLVHPATPAAASFCDDHLSSFLSRRAADLFKQYRVVTSRRGFVLLRRRIIEDQPKSHSCFDLCVYDPMSDARTFFADPPEIRNSDEYVLLTAADGIARSFVLLVAENYGVITKVQMASSCDTWGPATYVRDGERPWAPLKNHCNPAVLRGGIIHWLGHREKILSYDVGTGKTCSVKLPPNNCDANQLHLVTSSGGEVLKLLAIEGFTMSVWLQLPIAEAGGSGWSLEAVIDIKEKMRSLHPDIVDGVDDVIEFHDHGERIGQVVFLVVRWRDYRDAFIVFDLETKEMHMQKRESILLEIDLPSRIQNMKIYS